MNHYRLISHSPYLYWIEEPAVRSFLFVGTDGAMLVDTGKLGGDLHPLVQSVTSLPLQLVHSHADIDHISGDRFFPTAFLHPGDYTLLRDQLGEEAPEPVPLEDGQVLPLGGLDLEVIHLPGHTPGSIALLDRAHRLLCAGDIIQKAPIYLFGRGRDVSLYVSSLDRLVALRHCFDTILSSHGQPVLPADYLLHLLDGAQRLRDGLLSPVAYEHPYPAPLYRWHDARFLYKP